jgi:hypothetical protein
MRTNVVLTILSTLILAACGSNNDGAFTSTAPSEPSTPDIAFLPTLIEAPVATTPAAPVKTPAASPITVVQQQPTSQTPAAPQPAAVAPPMPIVATPQGTVAQPVTSQVPTQSQTPQPTSTPLLPPAVVAKTVSLSVSAGLNGFDELARVNLTASQLLQIPGQIEVAVGSVGNHKVTLRLDNLECEYRASDKNSVVLTLRGCDNDMDAGSILTVHERIELRIYGIKSGVTVNVSFETLLSNRDGHTETNEYESEGQEEEK